MYRIPSCPRPSSNCACGLGVLRFGEFKLKSGRAEPVLLQCRLVQHRRRARRARALLRRGDRSARRWPFDVLFGPAYKGIPLVAAASIALADRHGRDVPWAFNRKEAKDHGEGGSIVGAPLRGRVLIVDDVITAGTAIREAVDIITAAGAQPAGVVLALDRQERGTGQLSAVQEVEQTLRPAGDQHPQARRPDRRTWSDPATPASWRRRGRIATSTASS